MTINLFSTPPADGTFPVASGLPIPDGPFAMSFGAYWPSERIAPEEIRWTLPPDEPVGAFASSEAM